MKSIIFMIVFCFFIGLAYIDHSRYSIIYNPLELKSDVLKDLPEVIETNVPVELNEAQKEAYKKIWENKSSISSEAGSFFSVLGSLL